MSIVDLQTKVAAEPVLASVDVVDVLPPVITKPGRVDPTSSEGFIGRVGLDCMAPITAGYITPTGSPPGGRFV